MIADRTCRAVSFLAARVKSRLRFAAPTGHKARRVLAHRAFRQRSQDQDQTVSDGSWPEPGLPLIERSRPPFIGLGVGQKSDPHLPFDPTRVLRQLPKWNSHSGSRLGRQFLGHCRRSILVDHEAASARSSAIRISVAARPFANCILRAVWRNSVDKRFLALSELCSTASGLRKKTGRFPCRHSARDATARSRMAAAM
jgi:hypothetical protein